MSVKRFTYKAGVTLGGQDVVNLDYHKIPFQASVVVDLVSGTVNYKVEYTTDDISKDPPTFRWLTWVDFPADTASTKQSTLNFPVTAVRLSIQSITREVRFSVIQGIGI